MNNSEHEEETELYCQICDAANQYFDLDLQDLDLQKLCKESMQESMQNFFKAMQKKYKALRTYDLFKHKNKEDNFLIVSKTKKAYISPIWDNKKKLELSGYSLETKEQGREFFKEKFERKYEML
ncbi:hypothetical protein [Campylobacter vulpis]|uniref:hypothetical protein n=1 Tax=Campylobacter vulpis TaxID=1655500 RepID=UPI001BCC81AE|nr:hypothetical protein [Campylobacter vulpis]MBS4407506.1 hypothetical protein [Campylobacter vulpis]